MFSSYSWVEGTLAKGMVKPMTALELNHHPHETIWELSLISEAPTPCL
jgi:hypothetical protein